MRLPERMPLSPEFRVKIAWVMFLGSLIGWPLSHVWVIIANTFDPFEQLVLALSWWAITTTAWDILSTSDVRVEQDD